MSNYRKVYKEWMKVHEFFWGDPMDFRFLVSFKLGELRCKNVLDIGCSAGILLNCVQSDHKIGIDINISSLRKGKKLYPAIEFIAASATFLPFRDGTIHEIISVHTLDDYSIDQRLAISEIKRICSTGGGIFLVGNWYNYKYKPTPSDLEKTIGSWIAELGHGFDIQTKWYLRPNLSSLQSKIKKLFLTKLPDFVFGIIRPDRWLYDAYVERSVTTDLQPYIVSGQKL